MTTIARFAKNIFKAIGADLIAYRSFLEIYQAVGVDVMFDVGANTGQYGLELLRSGFKGQIHSFEPGGDAFEQLSKAAGKHPNWKAHKIALGSTEGSLELSVYADSRFSSFLHLNNQATTVIGRERVNVKTLDLIFDGLCPQKKLPALKIDTQGFEREVLKGGQRCLERFAAVQMEASWAPIYDNQWLMEEALVFMRQRGFTPVALKKGYFAGCREYECDLIFVRNDMLGRL